MIRKNCVSKVINVFKNSYYKRINKGMGVVEAMTTPKGR